MAKIPGYYGYLTPHMADIINGHLGGKTIGWIADDLWGRGVRPVWWRESGGGEYGKLTLRQMVRYVLVRTGFIKKKKRCNLWIWEHAN